MAGGLGRMSRCLGAKGLRAVGKRFLPPGLGSQDFIVCGGAPRTKPQGFNANKARRRYRARSSQYSNTIQALLAELTDAELEHVASAVIRDYQWRMRQAQAIFEELSQLEGARPRQDVECRRHEYRVAMLNVHAQHQLVSLVVNRLGHVPEVDGQRPLLN